MHLFELTLYHIIWARPFSRLCASVFYLWNFWGKKNVPLIIERREKGGLRWDFLPNFCIQIWQSRQTKPPSENCAHLGTHCCGIVEQRQGCTWDSFLLDCIQNQHRMKNLSQILKGLPLALHFVHLIRTFQARMGKGIRVEMQSVQLVGLSIPPLWASEYSTAWELPWDSSTMT